MTPSIHSLASIFPPMGAEEYARFADSIERDGLLEPITLFEGQILDGRHRQRACDERGIEARYQDWNPDCGITPLEWVIAVNLHRRHLTTAQTAALAIKVQDQLAEAMRERMQNGGQAAGRGRPNRAAPNGATLSEGRERHVRADEIAAKQFGISARSVSRAAQIRRRDPQIFERMKAGELTITQAQKLVGIHDPGGHSNHARPRRSGRRSKEALREALAPLRKYLKDWTDDRLYMVSPSEAERLLKVVQEVDRGLFEVERALEARSVKSRALE
jgi:ParB/Sulfiredoxin domain